MNKEDVLIILETIINNPGSYKSGEYLKEQVTLHSVNILKTNRQGLIEALVEWINTKAEPRSMLAVRVAHNLNIVELIPQIQGLRNAIAYRNVFPYYYLKYIDEVLESLTK